MDKLTALELTVAWVCLLFGYLLLLYLMWSRAPTPYDEDEDGHMPEAKPVGHPPKSYEPLELGPAAAQEAKRPRLYDDDDERSYERYR